MIGLAEIVRSVYGAWRLLRGDPAGMHWFDASPGGVVRSFWGPGLVLPGVLVMQALDGAFDQDLARPLIIQVIAFLIGCTAYPLAVSRISADLGRAGYFPRYLAAYNWSAVVQIAALGPATGLTWLFPGAGFALFSLVVTIALLFYQAYIARIALMVAPMTAALLVTLDLLLGTLIQTAADYIAG